MFQIIILNQHIYKNAAATAPYLVLKLSLCSGIFFLKSFLSVYTSSSQNLINPPNRRTPREQNEQTKRQIAVECRQKEKVPQLLYTPNYAYIAPSSLGRKFKVKLAKRLFTFVRRLPTGMTLHNEVFATPCLCEASCRQ